MRTVAAISCMALVLSGCDYFGAKLPANDVDAARMCWPVASAKNLSNGGYDLAGMAEVITYAMIVAKAQPGDEGVFEKVGKVTNTKLADSEMQKLRVNLDSLQGQCRARFAAADGKVAPTMPTDPLDRADWCLLAAVFTESLAQGGVRLTEPERQRVAGVKRAAIASFTDAAVAAKGLASETQVNAYHKQQADAMTVNRLDKVIDACPTV